MLQISLYRATFLVGMLCLFLAPAGQAETLTVSYTEPSASATLARTTIYWCTGSTCANWREATLASGATARQPSDNGNGLDAKSIPIRIDLAQGSLPLTVRIRVTATDTSGNETAGVITSHTFSP